LPPADTGGSHAFSDTHRPGLQISATKQGGYTGNNVFSPPDAQVQNVDLDANEKEKVFVKVQNDGGKGKILVGSSAEDNEDRTIKYKVRGKNVTAKITSVKGYKVKLAENRSRRMKIVIRDLGVETGDDRFFVGAEDKATGANVDSVGVYLDRP
jgi:hypothetical protein